MQNALREKKAGGQFEIVAGGSHRNRDGFTAQADFERLFDGQQVLKRGGGIAFDFLDGYGENRPVHTDLMVTRLRAG